LINMIKKRNNMDLDKSIYSLTSPKSLKQAYAICR
jgi:hypothetical protein